MLFESEKDFLGKAAMMATSDLHQPVVQRVRDILKGDPESVLIVRVGR
jgi:hypothetical protein